MPHTAGHREPDQRFSPKNRAPFAHVPEAQRLAREGVEAYGDLLRPSLMRDIGTTLGGLNEIGALRSGGTTVAMNDLTQTYADRIGAFARGATLDAIGSGLQGRSLALQERGLDLEERRMKDARRASLLGAIGSVLGAGVGFVAGGPFGAAAGASAGGKVGGGKG